MAARHQFLGPSLGESGTLTLHCQRCDYKVIMPGRVAVARYGWGATPHSIRVRSRCSVCNRTDRVHAHI